MDKNKRCQRCRWEWVSRVENPAKCPQCGSPYWNKPRMPRSWAQLERMGVNINDLHPDMLAGDPSELVVVQ